MIKKSSWVFLLAISCYLTAATYTYAGWPINRTLPIEGTITDATTGEPIENVIVSCNWAKEISIPNFHSRTFSRKLTITGRDGRYKIPGRVSFHIIPIISRFEKVFISARHPLYESAGSEWNAKDIKELKKGVTGGYEDGKIRLDIKLLSLEEKYRGKYDERGLVGCPNLEPEYFISLKYLMLTKKVKPSFNLDNFLSNIERIIETRLDEQKNHPKYIEAKAHIQGEKERIYHIMSMNKSQFRKKYYLNKYKGEWEER